MENKIHLSCGEMGPVAYSIKKNEEGIVLPHMVTPLKDSPDMEMSPDILLGKVVYGVGHDLQGNLVLIAY